MNFERRGPPLMTPRTAALWLVAIACAALYELTRTQHVPMVLAFPWIPIILALISFFLQKSRGKSMKDSLLTAALVGGGAYWLTTQTDWGKDLAAKTDDLFGTTTNSTSTYLKDKNGNDVLDKDGNKIIVGGTTTGATTGPFDVLKSWGATGTATVLGAGAIAAGKTDWLWPVIIGAGALLILTR